MNLSTLLREIETKTTRDERWDDPNYLSDLLLELGSYFSILGSHVAEAQQGADLRESHYKVAREQSKLAYVEEGDTLGVAESKARIDTKQEEEDYIALKYKANLLKYSRESLARSIDVVRSKLSFVKKDMENPQ